ncbi:MAG: hypothetical protein ACRCT2_03895 [Plesiomonas shigelloides]
MAAAQDKGFDLQPDEMNCSPFGALNGGKLAIKFRNQLNQKAIAQAFSRWLEDKAAVRLVKQVWGSKAQVKEAKAQLKLTMADMKAQL